MTIGDTTYAYDERADAWSTWSLKVSSSAMYGVETQLAFVPGDTLYFTQPGDSTLYRYGSSETDNGAPIGIRWKSVPLFGNGYRYGIDELDLWVSQGASGNGLYLYFYDEGDTLINSSYPTSFTDLTKRLVRKAPVANDFLECQLWMATATADTLNLTVVDGIDIHYKLIGYPTLE